MACPCGLTRQELTEQGLVVEQRCTALYELDDGTDAVCGRLFTSHASAQGKTLSIQSRNNVIIVLFICVCTIYKLFFFLV